MANIIHYTPEELHLTGMDKKCYAGIYQNVIKRIIDIVAGIIAVPFVLLIGIPVSLLI